MTTIEEALEQAPDPKPTRRKKPRRRRAHRRETTAPLVPRPAGEFAGMTAYLCGSACKPGACCMGTTYCAHPLKSGLQSKDTINPEIVARYGRAKKMLAHAKVEASQL